MKKFTLLMFLTFLLAGAVTAGIYKWVDERGNVHYRETPPAGSEGKQMKIAPGPSEEEIQRSRERTQQLIQEQKQRRLIREQQRVGPQEVLGTVVLSFLPMSDAVMPKPPIQLTLVIEPVGAGPPIKHRIADATPAWVVSNIPAGIVRGSRQQVFITRGSTHQNFILLLRPGDYKISEVLARSTSLSETQIALPTVGPVFTVPEGECVYVGRVIYPYLRLPPDSLAQTKAAVKSLFLERSERVLRILIYMPEGALVPNKESVDKPKEGSQPHDEDIRMEASRRRCVTELAKF